AARREGLAGILLPVMNACEAAIVGGLAVFPVSSLVDAVRALNEPGTYETMPAAPRASAPAHVPDLADVRGQLLARRALEIASAGGHNLLLVGPPGAGKTMMARRVGGILPPLTFDEALEVTSVHSVAGLLPLGAGLLAARPFRAPHHTISDVARYRGRLSGPLRDRLDLTVDVPALPPAALGTSPRGETSAVVRERVVAARDRQAQRYADDRVRTNAELTPARMARFCDMDRD